MHNSQLAAHGKCYRMVIVHYELCLLYQVFLYCALFLGEVNTDHIGFLAVECERQQVLLVLYLLQGLLGCAVKLKLYYIAIVGRFYQ